MIYLFVLLALIIGFFLGAIFIISRLRSKIGILYENGEKYLDMAEVLSIWMEYLENGNNIAESLQKKGYKKIAKFLYILLTNDKNLSLSIIKFNYE